MSDIFLSYARGDRSRAELLARALEAHGWSVFWDLDIPSGQTWRTFLSRHLADARCVVVAWSAASIKSHWVAEEAEDGLQRGILVPVLLDPVTPPIGFRSVQAADFIGWDGNADSEAFGRLVRDIGRLLGPPPRLAAEPVAAEVGGDATAAGDAEPARRVTFRRWLTPAAIAGVVGLTVVTLTQFIPFERAPPPPLAAVDTLNQPIWIRGGTFRMGSTNGESDEQPVHDVTVSGFWIQEHEVTNAEYERFDDGHQFPSGQERYPVVDVTWQEAMEYAESRGGSLPSEAQWEFAARGTAGRTYPWGEAEPTCVLAHMGGCGGRAIPVMSKPEGATREGVHDLAGNVFEWVRDWHGAYDSAGVTDPEGPADGQYRVLRGGAFNLGAYNLRGSDRGRNRPDIRLELYGFRVVWAQAQGPG